jgi:hypothetical protein
MNRLPEPHQIEAVAHVIGALVEDIIHTIAVTAIQAGKA